MTVGPLPHCSICDAEDDREHHHKLGMQVMVYTQWNVGHLSATWLKAPLKKDRSWTIGPFPAHFKNEKAARRAVERFVAQKHDPPLNDGYGTVIVGVHGDYGFDAHLTYLKQLDREDKVVVVKEHVVLWRSRPKEKRRAST